MEKTDPREPVRTGTSLEVLKRAFLDNLFYVQARFPEVATRNDNYQALAYTVRDRLLQRWLQSARTYKRLGSRTVCYFSAEFLLGPHLGSNLLNLGLYDRARRAMAELGLDLDDLMEEEEEPGLGNGGLGRLAACYMDSLATLSIPAIGYGIRYEYGIFDQEIRDGWQIEITDKWLLSGNPWEIPRPKITFPVGLGGRTERFRDEKGLQRVRWVPGRVLRGMAYDTPILGYGVNNANLLRLWSAAAVESFDIQAFNIGDYYGAVEDQVASENLTKVLYPNSDPPAGRQLRLEQQYFFVSCSLQDMIRIYSSQQGGDLRKFHGKYAVQLNDTHPSIAVAELMRLLVDEYALGWEEAWEITRNTFAYTNHTLLPEALEKWPLSLFASVLPRHLEIVFEINRRFLDEVRMRFPGDAGRAARLSLIDESGERYVRMAHLACVGSRSVNGVAEMHTGLLRKEVLKDFNDLWPERFSNKTNGVTPRRFLLLSNPRLGRLITAAVGEGWERDLERLRGLESLAGDDGFRREWEKVQGSAKKDLAAFIAKRAGIAVDPRTMFDVQVKRIHEYKRQHLNVLHIVTLYSLLKKDPSRDIVPRTFIFGGKAAPGYFMAKLIIKLINSVGEVVNGDPDVAGRLKVVFVPDFNVRVAQRIYPAADLSEQISTAGKEASGTGNMKFSMNGALTIGTLDGANVEIRREVGEENFFLFGLTAEEIVRRRAEGYHPRELYRGNEALRESLDLITSGLFTHGDTSLFRPLVESLLGRDDYMVLADYQGYVDCQRRVEETWREGERWTRMSILNTARMGKFSSDRAIAEYCRDIWRVEPIPIEMGDRSP